MKKKKGVTGIGGLEKDTSGNVGARSHKKYDMWLGITITFVTAYLRR